MFPQAILFDLDNTLFFITTRRKVPGNKCCSFVTDNRVPFDAETLLEAVNREKNRYWSNPERYRAGRLNINQARRDIVKKALASLQFYDDPQIMVMVESISKLQKELVCLFPESIRTLEHLKSAGIKMVLITNGMVENQRPKIEKFNLARFFEFCLIEEEVGFGKPDLRVFQLALQKLHLKPDRVWMVGDNLVWDVEAPQK
jgi:putative hydrolase of the HAD superfamily